MPIKVIQQKYIADFKCDSSKCIQNCCSIYTIWVDQNTFDFYKSSVPELYNIIDIKENNRYIIPYDDNGCILMENGLCKIHSNYGASYLPDVCYGYPRAYYKLGDNYFMTSNLLCDHLIRLIYDNKNAFSWVKNEVERIPLSSIEVIPEEKFAGNNLDKILDLYNSLIKIVDDENYNSEEVMIRLVIIANLLNAVKESDWPNMLKEYLNFVNKDLVSEKYEQNNNQDSETFDKLLHTLLDITKDDRSEKLSDLFNSILSFFEQNDSVKFKDIWKNLITQTPLDIILKIYIKAKLSEYFFPVNNWSNCIDDITIIAANYLTVRLALILNYKKLDNFSNLDEIARLISVIEPCFYIKRVPLYHNFLKHGIINQPKILSLLMNY